jgi:hypothetical protein
LKIRNWIEEKKEQERSVAERSKTLLKKARRNTIIKELRKLSRSLELKGDL